MDLFIFFNSNPKDFYYLFFLLQIVEGYQAILSSTTFITLVLPSRTSLTLFLLSGAVRETTFFKLAGFAIVFPLKATITSPS